MSISLNPIHCIRRSATGCLPRPTALRSSRLFLEDILARAELVAANLRRYSREEIVTDSNLYEATLRHVEIIGEAVKNLPTEFKEANPEIPRRQIGRTRDILAPVYFGVSEDRVWDIVSVHLPALAAFVRKALEEPPTPQ